ncbi:She10p NDAI_0I03120 [Naumovozyma dairenensis CBS 421]|uniref:Outer spore wall assembly protein SHE10 n=1 Tax=Naumovozyma dairenensis (strain ATCC 10597 / BCRC 20456 / CBS 421 / NBRC 0211 / NRRL Y-12639) TaxID=1071378 RepID=G0WGG9_NAUDC|nr:hypothetical protein NDAI_0I03120 [Naumovozyma dairenensis CBS 421]CCD26880.1 hypothetical protein NDAI_0I03120 [Naumovozyma dairenensis CBS 421]
MRCCVTKYIVTLITIVVSLHYYCQVNDCSGNLQQVCHYTTPKVWDSILSSKVPAYNEYVSPGLLQVKEKYSTYIQPHLSPYCSIVHEKVITPSIACSKKTFAKIKFSPFRECLSKHGSTVQKKVNLYYNIYIQPYYVKFVQPYTNKLCPFVAPVCHQVKNQFDTFKQMVGAQYSTLQGKIADKVSSISSSVSASVSTSVTTATTTATSTVTDSIVEERDYNEDEEEIDTDTETSTVIKTVTVDTEEPIATATPADVSSSDVDINEQAALQADFENWSNTISNKIESITKLFDKDVNKFMKKTLNEKKDMFSDKIGNLNSETEAIFAKLNKAIQDISCIKGEDPVTGEIIYFNKDGTTQIEKYVDRPFVRELFEEAHNSLNDLISDIQHEEESLIDQINKRVQLIREEHLDLYEDWADTMINEWSKRMAYVDVVAAHLNNEENGDDEGEANDSDENWKKFLSVKKQAINSRDELITHPAKVEPLENFFNEIQETLKLLSKDAGEYLYILRSKANLEFQAREEEEGKKEESQVSDETEVEAESTPTEEEEQPEVTAETEIEVEEVTATETEIETATEIETEYVAEETNIPEDSAVEQDQEE